MNLPTAAPLPIQGLSELSGRYDALLCDVWGVIHNGRQAFPDACQALARYRAERGPVILISNSPRPNGPVITQMRQLGVPDEAWSVLVTSGDVTRHELSLRAPGPAWAIGPMRDAPLYEGTGVHFAEVPEEAAFVSCTGPFDDEIETPADFRDRFEVCLERKLVMVCANPDKIVQRGNKTIYCGGALADLYAEMGGEVVMAGKPYSPIYDACYAEAERLLGRRPDKARLLAIGDGLATDIRGANGENLDCLFLASGIHAADVTDDQGRLAPDVAADFLGKAGLKADYVAIGLSW